MRALEKPVWREETRGTFHSTKTFENLETAANGTEISYKSFQKFRKLLNFRMQTIQPKILEISGATSGKNIWVYLARLSSFSEILENAVPFASGSCRKFKPEELVEWKAPNID